MLQIMNHIIQDKPKLKYCIFLLNHTLKSHGHTHCPQLYMCEIDTCRWIVYEISTFAAQRLNHVFTTNIVYGIQKLKDKAKRIISEASLK